MNSVEIIGVKDHRDSKLLKDRVTASLETLGLGLTVKEITDLEAIVDTDISTTPALRINGKIILQQVIPEEEAMIRLLTSVLLPI